MRVTERRALVVAEERRNPTRVDRRVAHSRELVTLTVALAVACATLEDLLVQGRPSLRGVS